MTENAMNEALAALPSVECVEWTGYIDAWGYGRFQLDGNPRAAHRVVYELVVGEIPSGLVIDHVCHSTSATCAGGATCPHRRCVNPAHLEAVTVGTNNERKLKAARTTCVHGHPLTPENRYVSPRGFVDCRPCRARRNARYKAANRLPR